MTAQRKGQAQRSAPTRRCSIIYIFQRPSAVFDKSGSTRRTGMLSVRAGRRKCIHAEVLVSVDTGEIGTHAMHPPGKRIIDINKRQNRIETRGRTRRSAPTRRIVIRPSTIEHLHLTTRCAVECGVGGPLAGLVSYRILQASTHSAAGRAGTILDGNIRRRNPK